MLHPMPDRLPDLEERVAVVTGGSQGIGRGVACVLGAAGATVYFTGRNLAALESMAAEIGKRGGVGIGVCCDHADDLQVLTAGELARAYQFTDIDGRQPPAFRMPSEMLLD